MIEFEPMGTDDFKETMGFIEDLNSAITLSMGLPSHLFENKISSSAQAATEALEIFGEEIIKASIAIAKVFDDFWMPSFNKMIHEIFTRGFCFQLVLGGQMSWSDFFALYPDCLDNFEIRWAYQKYIWGLIFSSPMRLYRWLTKSKAKA